MPADRRLFDSSSLVTPPSPEIDAVTCTVENMSSAEPVHMSQGFVTCTRYEPNAVPMWIGDTLMWMTPDGPPTLVDAPSKTSGVR